MSPFAAVILAAGKGTRMKSDRPKVLHPICGRPMVEYVIDAAEASGAARTCVVVGHGADQLRAAVAEAAGSDDTVTCVEQAEQLGTGHAVLQCRDALKGHDGPVLILSGDVPLVPPEMIRGMLAAHERGITLLSVELPDPTGYGRVVRDGQGGLARIVEQKDATEEERGIHEVNAGIYVADAALLWPLLERVGCDNAQGEYYLPDIVALALADGREVNAYLAADPDVVLGVNSRAQLAHVSAVMQARINEGHMNRGVSFIDPAAAWVEVTVAIGHDTLIYPGVTLQGNTVIGDSCVLYPGTRIVDANLGNGCEIRDNSLITGATLDGDNTVGPSAHLRPEAHLKRGAKIGNYVEIKKAVIGEGSKVNHLSYVGDATVGKGVNIGAGTITCNYDGEKKHHTEIGDGVFIGSDSQLIAPVKVGKNALIAAGSTVTGDVPEGALAISRTPQKNMEGWVARRNTGKNAGKGKD